MNYYNELDPFAAAWLRELIKAGHIPPGHVDERSIEDVAPTELVGYTQCHFFAGIAGWSYALRLAGWPDDRPIWTGSCPCQPFSDAGKGLGFADERHLWPAWYHLIGECLPRTVMGEQVASPDGLAWLDLVQADMEAASYAFAPVDYCAAGVQAPGIRQRLWFVADSDDDRQHSKSQPGDVDVRRYAEPRGGMGDSLSARLPLREPAALEGTGRRQEGGAAEQPSRPPDPWAGAEWLWCRDNLWRPVEPGTFPVAPRLPGHVGRLRGYGNAINPYVAARMIRAYLDIHA